MTYILGIAALYHDSAACIIKEGEIIAAAQEERFTRKKHDASFPSNAIEYCLSEANCSLGDVTNVVFYDKPFLKFERLLETFVEFAPKGMRTFQKAIPIWVKEKLFLKPMLVKELSMLNKGPYPEERILFTEHHHSHAASAFFPSPFETAVVLTVDGVGEWATTSVAIGSHNKLNIEKEIHFPHSIGLLYSAFTYYLGFKVNSGEYKVMGLAPYGSPKFVDLIMEKIIDIKTDGTFRLNLEYFNFPVGLTMTNKKFESLFEEKKRTPEEQLTQFHMDVAASIQKITEIIMLKLTNALHDEYKIDNLCLAGGVALNCVANGVLLREGKFKNIWIQPAAGDAGGAIGAALAGWHEHLGNERLITAPDSMKGAYLGPSYTNDRIKKVLDEAGAIYSQYNPQQIISETATELANGKTIGWFQGRAEFGPRSLGSRSILADPTSSEAQKNVNLKIKFRESFRPFAPSVLQERSKQWFNLETDSPYMLLVDSIKQDKRIDPSTESDTLFGIELLSQIRSIIPAVTHVDYSARIQTVSSNTNKRYHALLTEFDKQTGCPVVLNTSFNVRGEPIVNTPSDAYRCFMGTNLDCLCIGDFFLQKTNQPKNLIDDYTSKFEMD